MTKKPPKKRKMVAKSLWVIPQLDQGLLESKKQLSKIGETARVPILGFVFQKYSEYPLDFSA